MPVIRVKVDIPAKERRFDKGLKKGDWIKKGSKRAQVVETTTGVYDPASHTNPNTDKMYRQEVTIDIEGVADNDKGWRPA